MAIRNDASLRGKIRAIAKRGGLRPQEVLQMFLFEHLLLRLEKTSYVDKFILKGGLLISSMIGVSLRATMDMDATVVGGVIGCKQFSCSGDAVWRLIMGCRRMLGAWDRAAIMAGGNVGLSKTRIAHLIGRSPSVVCREIARHTGPDGQYRAEEADKVARAARRRPKKRLLDCDEVLRRSAAW